MGVKVVPVAEPCPLEWRQHLRVAALIHTVKETHLFIYGVSHILELNKLLLRYDILFIAYVPIY